MLMNTKSWMLSNRIVAGICLGSMLFASIATPALALYQAPTISQFIFAKVGDQTTGKSFNITITAQDSSGATLLSYTGTVALTVSGTGCTIAPKTSNAFVGGILTQGVSITGCSGTRSITAKDSGTTGVTGSSNSFALKLSTEDAIWGMLGKDALAITKVALACYAKKLKSGLKNLTSVTQAQNLEDKATSLVDKEVPTHDKKTKQEIQDEDCAKKIEKAAAQIILKSLTDATVNWINHGFKNWLPTGTQAGDMDSAFPKDPQALLKSIGDQAVKDFSSAIGFDSTKFPFGKDFVQGLTGSLNSTFESSMQSTLNNTINGQSGGSDSNASEKFNDDFSYGGYDAFLAQLDPKNNPYGFQMKAQDELARRTKDTGLSTAQNVKDQLQRNNGLLDMRECVEYAPSATAPTTLTNSTPDAWGGTSGLTGETTPSISGAPVVASPGNASEDCIKWATTTPGSAVKTAMDKSIGSDYDQLGIGQDLEASLTAIFNALMKQLFSKGLSAFTTADLNTSGNNTTGSPYAGGTFNILTDIPTTIATQDEMKNTLLAENDTSAQLIAAIYRLDLCIPGPHPSWDTASDARASSLMGYLPSDADHSPSGSWSQAADKINTLLGTTVVGNGLLTERTGNTAFYNASGTTLEQKNARMYGVLFYLITGIMQSDLPVPLVLGTGGLTSDTGPYTLTTSSDFTNALQKLYDSYKTTTNHTFTTTTLPSQALTATAEYNRLPGYQQIPTDNQSVIDSVAGVDAQLASLQTQVAPIYAQVQADAKYKTQLAAVQAGGDPSALLAALAADPNYASFNDAVTVYQTIDPQLVTSTDVNLSKAGLADLKARLNLLTNPTGLIASCVSETSQSSYAFSTARIAYPNALSTNPDNLKISNAFLPGAFGAIGNGTNPLSKSSYPATGSTTSAFGGSPVTCPTTSTDTSSTLCPTSSDASDYLFEQVLGVY